MQARIENTMDCTCKPETCACCGNCNCKHARKVEGVDLTKLPGGPFPTPVPHGYVPNFGVDLAKLNTGLDGVKEVAVNLGKLSTSVDGFPKKLSAEVGMARDAAVGAGVSGVGLGLLLGLLLGLIFARR